MNDVEKVEELVAKLEAPSNCRERFAMLPPYEGAKKILCFDGLHVRSLRGQKKQDCCCVALWFWHLQGLKVRGDAYKIEEAFKCGDQRTFWEQFRKLRS